MPLLFRSRFVGWAKSSVLSEMVGSARARFCPRGRVAVRALAHPTRLRPKEVKHGGLGQHGLGNAVTLRACPFFGRLGRLEIGAEVACAPDNAPPDGKALRFESAQRRLNVIACERSGQSCRIISRLGHPG